MNDNQRITSNRAFVLAIAGAAVGLGNIWRFPYIVGENGGSLFLLIYLFFVVVMGLPVMVAEIAIGRAGRSSPANCLRKLAVANNGSRHWSKIAGLGTLAATLVLSFYSVISGWALYYFFESVCNNLGGLSVIQAENIFDQFLASPEKLVFFHTLFIVITLMVSARAVSSGIERLNTWLMPMMYIILLILVFYASECAGFSQALKYLFEIRVEAVDWSVLGEAMGHAFFTLAIGACCLMSYGAYMPERQSIINAVVMVAVMDVLVALMVGVASFTIVFTEGMQSTPGPGLMFIALPVALGQLPYGEWMLSLFFALLVFATWTSSVNLGEPLVVILAKKFGSRAKGAVVAGCIVWVMGLIPAFSWSLFEALEPWPGKTFFDVYTAFTTQALLPVTGFLTLIFAGYILQKKVLVNQLALSGCSQIFWLWLIKYISPLLVFFVLISGFF